MAVRSRTRQDVSHLQRLTYRGIVIDDIIEHEWQGRGTEEDPFQVDWITADFRNPMLWSPWFRWTVTVLESLGTFGVSVASTAFAGALPQVKEDLEVSTEVAILSISLFVLGFALGPM